MTSIWEFSLVFYVWMLCQLQLRTSNVNYGSHTPRRETLWPVPTHCKKNMISFTSGSDEHLNWFFWVFKIRQLIFKARNVFHVTEIWTLFNIIIFLKLSNPFQHLSHILSQGNTQYFSNENMDSTHLKWSSEPSETAHSKQCLEQPMKFPHWISQDRTFNHQETNSSTSNALGCVFSFFYWGILPTK